MVRAILEGRKTQTRRIVKPQPPNGCEYVINGAYSHALCYHADDPRICVAPTPKSTDHRLPCPYGQPGDRLWVRETWAPRGVYPVTRPDGKFGAAVIEYRADGQRATWNHDPIQRIKDDWRPSIFMPRWASRITLEVTKVRVERLQDINRGGAMAEGCPFMNIAKMTKPLGWYRDLWESINGPGSWAANPWVWVVEFRRINQ